MSKLGYSVYGLVRAADSYEFWDVGLEDEGKLGHVYSLREGPIAAVVAPSAGRCRLLPLHKNLEPYELVIREVMRTRTIIPMTLGHVATSEQEIRKMLRRNCGSILEQLERVDGKVEMGLKVVKSPDQLLVVDPERLARERHEQTGMMLELTYPRVRDAKVNVPRGERTVMDLSFLVERSGLKAFEEYLEQAADMFPASYNFELDGPGAPTSFIELELQQAAA